MKKKNELTINEPLYSTYHYQANTTAIISDNPSIENWYLNHAVNLKCSRRFLNGFTSPEITIINSAWYEENPYMEKRWFSSEFLGGYVNPVIRKLIDRGCYVEFDGVDDYYIEGKSWYKKRHFSHDGLICGYDQESKTYCIYAYDTNWVFRKFWTPQKAFNNGRIAIEKTGKHTTFCGLKPKKDHVKFSPKTVVANIKNYLDSDMEKYPTSYEGNVCGIAVQEYIVLYLDKLIDGSIPYEKMDTRVFRLIWEHKKAMLKRIKLLEKSVGITSKYSDLYQKTVSDADKMRLLYASHRLKRRDKFLVSIKEILLSLHNEEKKILTDLVNICERAFENYDLGLS